MKNNKISVLSRVFLLLAACMLVGSLFVPIWRIDLDAPQYPEGLELFIWADAIAGDVDIINGLNHYIGMKTLHTEDFIEFTVLPYIIGIYALFFVVAALIGKRGWLNAALIAFVIFGVVAMVDFWKWEYDYGHDLDPNAAIKVPGMAYQPPLIGFKQLLNFGAYSIPATGGWLFVGAGVLVLMGVLKEWRDRKTKLQMPRVAASLALLLMTTLVAGCGTSGADPINLHKDGCDFCRMNISDGKFGAEVITQKGRVYKFDDMQCLLAYTQESKPEIKSVYVHDYLKDNQLIDATQAYYIHHNSLKSPMAGNIAAFADQSEAEAYAKKLQVKVMTWNEISQLTATHEHHSAHNH